jgi:hypothetical protein
MNWRLKEKKICILYIYSVIFLDLQLNLGLVFIHASLPQRQEGGRLHSGGLREAGKC